MWLIDVPQGSYSYVYNIHHNMYEYTPTPPTDTNIHTTSLSKLRTVGVHSQCHTQPIHLLPQMQS